MSGGRFVAWASIIKRLGAFGALSAAACTLLSCAGTPEGGTPDGPIASRTAQALTLGPVNVLTRNYDNSRAGANLSETTLSTTNVAAATFGKLFQIAVDDQVAGGLLYASSVPVNGVNLNLVYVTTVNNSVYAFDADAGGTAVWQKNFNGSGRPTSHTEVGGACGAYGDFSGNIGIVGTPVIDGASGTLYFVTRTVEAGSTVQRLHAVDITTGEERASSPQVITMSVPGTGVGQAGGTVSFNPVTANQRPALALSQGVVYVAWSSYCDTGPYHGWLAGFDATTLALTGTFNVTPKGSDGGIWMGGAAPAVDAAGNLYVSTGNGDWDGVSNFGESVVKLAPGSLAVGDYFTAGNYAALTNADEDFGSSGPVLLPGTTQLVSGSKEGKVYLLQAGNLGQMAPGDTQLDQWFQAVNPTVVGGTHHIHNSCVAWQSPAGLNLYVWGENDFLRGYRYDPSVGKFTTTPFASGPTLPPNGMPGGMLTLSANGGQTGSGILWATTPRSGDANHDVVPGALRAYNAESLALLWDSTADTGNDTLNFAKFSSPIVANGKVYVASFSNGVTAYGLRPSVASPYSGTPVSLPGTIEAENFDLGGEGVAFHDTDPLNNGGEYRTEAVDIQVASEGSYAVGWTAAGEWLKYSVNVSQAGPYTLSARVAAAQAGGAFRVELDGTDVTGTISVPSTGGYATWATVSRTGVTLPAGVHVLRLFELAGNFNLNSLTLQVAAAGSCTTAADCNDNNPCTVDACASGTCSNATGNSGVVCRAAVGACDAAETCSGVSATCPTDVRAANGSACNDGNVATCSDVCTNGVCAGVTCGSGPGPYNGTAVTLPGTVEAENFDLGGEGVGYHDSDTANQGGAYRPTEGVDLQSAAEGGYYVGWIVTNEWLKYSVNVAQAGTYTLSARVGSGQAGGSFRVEVDGSDVTGTLAVPSTGSWSSFTTLTKTGITLPAASHVLRVFIVSGNFNLNSLSFAVAVSGSCTTAADCNDNNPCTADACASGTCSNAVANAGVVCRAAASACDLAETCTGASATCPADVGAANGSTCNDGNAATCNDVCTNGACAGSTCGAGSGPYGGTAVTLPGTVEAENFDLGGEGVGYHDSDAANNGGAYRSTEGVDLQSSSEGGYYIGWIVTGEWLKYSVNVAQTGTYTLSARVGSGAAGGSFRIEVDGTDVTGSLAVPSTGSWSNFTTLTKTGIALPSGSHLLRVYIVSGNFNLNSLSFAVAASGSCNTAADCNDNNPCTVDACTSNICSNAIGNAGVVCRAAGGACDVAETCTGASATCPADVGAANGSTCNDGNAATCSDVCTNGVCAGVTCGSGSGPYTGTAVTLPGTVEAENFDLGGEGVAYHDSDTANNGGAYRPTEGVDLQAASEGNYSIGWIVTAEWLKYSVNVAQAGSYTLSARVGSGQAGGSFRVEVDGTDVTGTLAVPSTGSWSSFTTLTKTAITLPSGSHVLRVYIVNGGFNLNSLSFIVAASGSCNTAADCNDNNPCTVDACASNICSNAIGNAGVTCRAAASACDAPETCTGTSASCPADAALPNGSSCNDGNALTCSDVCTSGVCAGATCGSGSGPYGGTAVTLPGTVEAENFDLGGEAVAYHDSDTANNGGAYRPTEGVDLQSSTEGGYYIGWIVTGEWLKYSVNVAQAGSYTLSARVGSGQAGGSFRVEVDGSDVTGTLVVPSTGSWSSFTTLTKVGVTLPSGSHVLRVYIVNGGFNLNSLSFVVAASGSCNTAADCNDNNPCTVDACTSNICSNAIGNAGVVCRAAGSACDAAEACTGTSATCPADAALPNGSSCNDGNALTCSDVCSNAVCAGATCASGSGPYSGTAIALPGTIEAENFDLGGEGVAYHDLDSANQGGAYRTAEGVDLESASEGGYNVGWTLTGEWLKYSVNVSQATTYTLTCRVASGQAGGQFRVEVDGSDVTGTLTVPSTGGWGTWKTLTKTGVALPAGNHVLRVYVVNSGFNLNNLKFQ